MAAYIAASARAISLAWLQPSGYMAMPTEQEIIDLAALDRVGLRQALDQARGDLRHRLLGLDVGEQQQELVAADPGHHVLAARHRLQALADLLEHEVADRVAVGVVDRLEAVEVDEQQRQAAGVGVGLGRRAASRSSK